MLYSPPHNLCLYKIPDPGVITGVVPQARQVSREVVAVPCELDIMRVMRNLGYEAYSPILHDYDWPRNPAKVPFPWDHQRLMAAFLTLHARCFNLCDMGTGKTLATLWAADYLMRQGVIRRALIITPLSTIHRVWEDEIFSNFLSRRSSAALYGDRAKRLKLLNEDHDFYIINHDGLGVGTKRDKRLIILGELAETIRDRDDIDLVIVDEGSAYKESGTDRYKVLKRACGDKQFLWWLTGTPAPNAPTDAWAQAKMVRPGYNESAKEFKSRTMLQVSQFKWLPKNDAAEQVASLLQPAIRFAIEDCIDLPECVYQTRDVALSPGQKKAYDELKKQASSMIGKGLINAVNEAALRQKLIQVACGAVYGSDKEVHRVDAAPRLSELSTVIDQSTHKIIVFAPLTSVINLLYHELHNQFDVAKVNGQVTSNQRKGIFRDFQDGNHSLRILIADPRTMAHGLTLTAASTIVWYGPTDSTELYTQANRRINRPGQRNRSVIVRLCATPTEREIYKRLDNNESMQGLILDLVKRG